MRFGICASLIGACTVVVINSFVVWNLQLTAAETVALVPRTGSPTRTSSEVRFHWLKAANPAANRELRRLFLNPEFPRQQVTAAKIFGYTGSDADAKMLVDYLRKKCRSISESDIPEAVHPDDVIILEVYLALGLMARRGVKSAKRFITNMVTGKEKLVLPLAVGQNETVFYSLSYYGLMNPSDLSETAQEATKRATQSFRDSWAGYDWTETLRWIEREEGRIIWKSDLEALRKKIR